MQKTAYEVRISDCSSDVCSSYLTVLQVGHGMALGNDGLSLSGDLTYAWSKPGIGGLPLSSETMIATAALAYPLARRQVHTLLATGGLAIVNQDLRFGAATPKLPLPLHRLRFLFLRLEGEQHGRPACWERVVQYE